MDPVQSLLLHTKEAVDQDTAAALDTALQAIDAVFASVPSTQLPPVHLNTRSIQQLNQHIRPINQHTRYIQSYVQDVRDILFPPSDTHRPRQQWP